jgi:hypothetical protein
MKEVPFSITANAEIGKSPDYKRILRTDSWVGGLKTIELLEKSL